MKRKGAIGGAWRGRRLPILVLCFAMIPALSQGQEGAGALPPVLPQPVIQRVVPLPPDDVRRVTLPELASGAVVEVRFDSLAPNHPAQLEVLLRSAARNGAAAYRSVYLMEPTERGRLRLPVSESGTYVVAIRQPRGARRSINVGLQVTVEPAPARVAPYVRTLPTGTRIAVAVFSAGFLWTTILLCGAPIIRAFRRRRTLPPRIWFG